MSVTITNGDVFTLWNDKGKVIKDVVKELLDRYGEYELGSEKNTIHKVRRLIETKPRKPKESDVFKKWEKAIFLHITEHGGLRSGAGRPESKLSDNPKERTTKKILKPKIEELISFADEQGVGLEELIELISQKC